MRKPYNKPEISFENFAMSTNIAGTCDDGFQTNSSTVDSCEYNHNGMIVFGTSNGTCIIKTDEKTCYDVPTAGVVLFSS